MKYINLIAIAILLFSGCKSSHSIAPKTEGWFNVSISPDVEIYTDTASIRREGAVTYAREKRVYITPESRKVYVDKIRDRYAKLKKPQAADRWSDFSYCVYSCVYECTNKRMRITTVEDYDSTGKLILKTPTPEDNIKWVSVDSETVRDYTFFFVCDYQQ